MDLIENSVDEYFENIEFYCREDTDWKDKLPYFEALRNLFEEEHKQIFNMISERKEK